MYIKIECACGTRFGFDVEPVNGRMPMNINCPACNACALDLANAEIQRQLAPASAPIGTISSLGEPPPAASTPPIPPAVRPSMRVAIRPPAAQPVATVPTPPPATTAPAMRIAVHAAPAPAPAEAPGVTLCARHKTEPATDTCVICHKPICPKCMELFGHVCSAYCRQQGELKGIDIPVYAQQRNVAAGKSRVRAKWIVTAGVMVTVLALGFYVWYGWFARNPKVVFTQSIYKPDGPPMEPKEFYQLIAPNQLLSLKNRQLTLMDVTPPRQRWSMPLISSQEAEAATNANREKLEKLKKGNPVAAMFAEKFGGNADADEFVFPTVKVTSNDLWVCFPEAVFRFDRQTGGRGELALPDKILRVTAGEQAILVLCGDDFEHATLAQISLPDGAVRIEAPVAEPAPTEDNTATNKAALAKAKARAGKPGAVKPSAAQAEAAREEAAKETKAKVKALLVDMASQARRPGAANQQVLTNLEGLTLSQFVPAGPNVAEVRVKMVAANVVEHEAMKAPPKKSLVDDALTAGKSMEAAQEELNNMQRGAEEATVTEDLSRYQVTLHRRLAAEVPDWTGEVISPPQFIPLKTVDILAAGKKIYAFDKQNRKLWEANLTYSAPLVDADTGEGPWLETGDALYFADLGVLARYDLATGNVRWRLNSVGVSHVREDARGQLYVTTTTATPDAIEYSQQINLKRKTYPVILKVNRDNGAILWRLQSVGDDCEFSGKYLYASRISTAIVLLRLEEGPDLHYNLNLLDPASGRVIWNYHQGNRRIIRSDFQNNWAMLQFDDGVEVLKFWSF